MPAPTERARRFFGAELARKRAGKATETQMTESQLRDFARKPKRAARGKRSMRRGR